MDAARERGNSERPAPHQPPAGGSFPPRESQSSAAGMPPGKGATAADPPLISRLRAAASPQGEAKESTQKGGTHLAISTKKVHNAGQQYAAVCHLKLQLQTAQLLYPAVS